MALTIKDSSESNSSGKPGVPSQNTQDKSVPSPRSNPVCLEVGVTLRSLPGEAGGLSQPIREEARTVIVFDNGAVVRSTSNLPSGQKIILSNHNGRDVVCRVGSSHNLPSVKGYVEVEFLEPVSDFWNIHQDGSPPPPAASPAPSTNSRLTQAPPPAPIRPISLDAPAKPSSVTLGKGPTFEDIPGLVTTSTTVVTRDSKPEPAKPGPDKMPKGVSVSKGASEYNHSEMADPTSLAGFDSPSAGLHSEVDSIPLLGEASAATHHAGAPTHDFLSQGLMAYEKPSESSEGRSPALLGIAALVLVAVGGVVFFMHKGSSPVSQAKKTEATQPSAALPATSNPEPAEQPLESAAKAAGDAAAQTPASAQPTAIEQDLPFSAVAPVPAVATSAVTSNAKPESRTDARTAKRPEKAAVSSKQPPPAASPAPAMPNLKIGAPSAPSRTLANAADASMPMTDVSSTEAAGGVPSANLLTSSGRTSNPPPAPSAFPPVNTPPPPAAAAKTVREPQLVSSVRPAYPLAAKQSGVQGSVSISLSIDASGRVTEARALSGPMLLRQAAVDSVKSWKYSPALIDGKPAPAQVTVSVEFKLN